MSVGVVFEGESRAACADADAGPAQVGVRAAAERAVAGAPVSASALDGAIADALREFALDSGDVDVELFEETSR